MIQKLEFKNYRCFENSAIDFRNVSVVVGNNNAGKSTLIEALRIIGFVSQKFKHAMYIDAPNVLGLPVIIRGIKLNIDHLKIDLRTIVNQYKKDTFAQITAYFDGKVIIRVYLSEELVFAYIEAEGKVIHNKSKAQEIEDLDLYIMP